MGYRGKLAAQAQARRMRAENRTLADIAATLGVSKSSVSVWVRDVPFTPSPRRYGPQRRTHPAHTAKLRQIEELDALGVQRIGTLGEDAFLVAGVALYAGEGAKGDGVVKFANTDPRMIAFFCAWLRRFFVIDEARLRAHVYLHEGLDLEAAERHWARVTGVPRTQFRRAVPGCCRPHDAHNQARIRVRIRELRVQHDASHDHGAHPRAAILGRHSGVAQLAERLAVNQDVESSSLSPGAHGPSRRLRRPTSQALDGWSRDDDMIVKTYELPSFPEAIAFVTRIADLAERADHHPDLDIRYRKVRVALSTHDQGGITDKDFALAAQIEAATPSS